LVDGTVVAQARLTDRSGRSLPRWSGCRTLRSGELFLLNPASADSFDGRYFGAISARAIVAVLKPLWLPGSPSPEPTPLDSPPPPVTKRNTK
jgi:type IV secretory pathway protease TraF